MAQFDTVVYPGLVADAIKNDDYQLLNRAWKKTSLLGTDVDNPVHLDGHYLGDYTTVNVRASKRVVKTEILGGKGGSIKEIIASNDFEITIRGRFESADLESYPAEELDWLAKLWKKDEAVSFESELISAYFDFDRVVIEEINLSETEGESWAQAFEIRCVSDGTAEDELTRIIE